MQASKSLILECDQFLDEKCKASCIQYVGLTRLWKSIVCPKGEFDEWNNVSCLYGQCQNYGVNTLLLYPNESKGSKGNLMK